MLLAALLLGGALLAQAAQAQNAPAPAPAAPGPMDAPALIPAACVPVDGMTFELAGSEALLVKKGEEAQALIHVSMFLPAASTPFNSRPMSSARVAPKAISW